MNHSLTHRRLLLYPHMRFSRDDAIHNIFNNPPLSQWSFDHIHRNNPHGDRPSHNPTCWHWRQEIRRNNPPPEEV